MSSKMEYTGKDVAEAIKHACEKLNLPQEKLQIEVKSAGSVGIFGLCRKKARIVVSLREDLEAAGSQPASRGAGRKKRGRKAAPAPETRVEKPAAAEPAAVPAEEEVPAAEVALSPQVVEEMAGQMQRHLSRILELMGFPSEVSFSVERKKVRLQISGDFTEEIIGPEGQTLDNLQYLLRKIASKQFAERITVSLDAGNYREARSRELEELARQLAAEVKETGKTRSIPALNPAERRIVHMVLQSDSTIRSRSVGDGLFKKILIYLPGKGKKRAPKGEEAADQTS